MAHSPLLEGSLNAHLLFLLEGLSCIGDFQALVEITTNHQV